MKTAIITLDIMNEICHPKGKLARYADRIANNNIINTINQITSWGRKNNALIIHVRVGFMPHYHDSSSVSPMFSAAKTNHVLDLESWNGQYCDELDIQPNDIQVIKHRVSAFYGTDLDLILRANRIENLVLTGVATNMAVELTAREAHDRDFVVTVVTDACEAASDEDHAASLRVLGRVSKTVKASEIMR